jgi:hypothetical protein
MTVQRYATVTLVQRVDAGSVRLGERDIAGLLLCGDQYRAPYDLLAAVLDVQSASPGTPHTRHQVLRSFSLGACLAASIRLV